MVVLQVLYDTLKLSRTTSNKMQTYRIDHSLSCGPLLLISVRVTLLPSVGADKLLVKQLFGYAVLL